MNILPSNNSWTICVGALLASCVLLLQNATVNADQLEEQLSVHPSLAIADTLPSLIRQAAHATRAEELNTLERDTLDSLTARFSPMLAADEESTEEAGAEELGDSCPTAHEETPANVPAAASAPESTTPPETAAAEPDPADPAEPPAQAASLATSPAPPVVLKITVAKPEPAATLEAPDSVASSNALAAAVPARLQKLSQRVDHALMLASEQAATLPESSGTESVPEATPSDPPATPSPSTDTPAISVTSGAAPAEAGAASPVPAAEAEEQKEPELTQAPPMRCRVLLLGDSLMEDMGPRVHKALQNRRGLEFIISAKFSTGLCRPDTFDWPKHMREVVSKYKPNLVVFFIGANDAMPMRTENRKYVQPGTAIWRETYKRRIDELVSIAREADMDIIWIEMPAVGGRYNKLLHDTQIAQREYCEANGIENLQTDPLLSGVWGKYEAFGEYNGKTVRLRVKDLTHLSPNGNRKVLDHLLPILEKHLISFYRAHPECALSEEEAAGIRRRSAIYTCHYDNPKPKPQQKPVEPPPAS